MLLIGLYLASSFFVAWRIAAFAGERNLPPLLSALLGLALIGFSGAMLPALCGFFSPQTVFSSTLFLKAGVFFFLKKTYRVSPKSATEGSEGLPKAESNSAFKFLSNPPFSKGKNVLKIPLLFWGFLLVALPLWLHFGFLVELLMNPEVRLPWDAYIYHLPAIVETFQNKTLFTLENPYQSYALAYEFFGALPVLLTKDPRFLFFANEFSVLLCACAIFELTYWLSGELIHGKNRLLYRRTAAGVAVVLWLFLFKSKLNTLGKNDIFLTGLLLSALVYLLYSLRLKKLRTLAILLSGAAAGLALSTKPTALGYVFGTSVLWLLCLFFFKKGLNFRGFVLWLGACLFFGSPFYLRNLIMLGSISDPALNTAFDSALLFNLFNPDLYRLHTRSLLTLFGLGLLLLSLFQGISKLRSAKPCFMVFALFFGMAAAAFGITPFVLYGSDVGSAEWQIRLGMPFFVCLAVFFGIYAALFYARLSRKGLLLFFEKGFLSDISFRKKAVGSGLAFFILLTFALVLQLRPLAALPFYDRYADGKTDVFEWAYSRKTPLRIYALDLLPYALYGKHWQHKVFYENSSIFNDEGVCRLEAVSKNFKPDILLYGKDWLSPDKPLIPPSFLEKTNTLKLSKKRKNYLKYEFENTGGKPACEKKTEEPRMNRSLFP